MPVNYGYGLAQHEIPYFFNYQGYGTGGQKEIDILKGQMQYLQNDPRQHIDWKKKGQSAYQARINELQAQLEQESKFTDPSPYFDPKMIQNLFNIAGGNLSRAAGGNVSAAQRTAAAQYGGGGYLNPGAAVLAAGSQARQPYAQAFGQLETGRAGALNAQQQQLLQALTQRDEMVERSRQFDVGVQQDWEKFIRAMEAAKAGQQAGTLDWLTPFLQVGGQLGAAAITKSDRRLKSNIRRIGTHPLGIGIYSYNIFGKPSTGVMADEVEKVKPEAVITGADGYKMVNYSMLR